MGSRVLDGVGVILAPENLKPTIDIDGTDDNMESAGNRPSAETDNVDHIPNLSIPSSLVPFCCTRTWMLKLPLLAPLGLPPRLAIVHVGSMRKSVKMLLNSEIPCLYMVGGATSERSDSCPRCDCD